VSAFDEPRWLREHYEIYGRPDDDKPVWSNPAYDACKAYADRREQEQAAIEKLLADVTEFQHYYARKMLLPKWTPGMGEFDA
jgi:hypothetical protein